MTSLPSLEEIVASLESSLAVHQERQAFHAERVRQHEEQRAHHAAEIETVTRKLATFKAALSEAADLPAPLSPAPPEPPPARKGPGGKVYVSRLVARVIEDKKAGEPFGISAITEEVNRRYRDDLRQPVKPRQVSGILRWMLRTARIRSLREGRPFHEALYVRA
ncbi:MAG TPA: hypothetical protein VKK31_09505 [Thermoanaerobaculia bacterium]|nr:hypothetical protein [Thermoanaerobaculia bacterium]